MAAYWDCVLILPVPADAAAVVSTLRDVMRAHGGVVAPDSNVVFNDFESAEREPEVAASEEDAFGKLLSWPGLGGVEYGLPTLRLTVFLLGGEAGRADAVIVSARASQAAADLEGREPFAELVRALHAALGAARTICGDELLSPGSWVPAEVERVRRGVFDGLYLTDLRH